MNAADSLLRSPPRAAALIDGTRVVGYGTLRRRVAATAAGWRADGMTPHARCALVLDDGIDWVVAFLGLVWLGALPVPLCPSTEPAALAELTRAHDLRWMLAEDRVAATAPLRRRHALRLVGLTDWLGLQPAPPISLRALSCPPQAPAWLRASIAADGRSRLVPQTHQQMLASAQAARERYGDAARDHAFHASGLCEGDASLDTLLTGLGVGATVTLGARAPAQVSRRATS